MYLYFGYYLRSIYFVIYSVILPII
jgi:hypothetical protein